MTQQNASPGGRVLAQRYEIIGELGSGAMGVVYQARDIRFDRLVAIKMILPGQVDERAIKKFVKEAKAMASLTHGNVAVIFDAGVEKGAHWIAMQFIEGKTLDDVVFDLVGEDKLHLFVEVVKAAAALHSAGVIHRDLKPDNLLVDAEGRVVVVDFGVALQLGASVSIDAIHGTPVYMSPEQVLSEEITFASDVYTLGKILLRILFGSRQDKSAGLLHWDTHITKLFLQITEESEKGVPNPLIRQWMKKGGYSESLIQIAEKCLHPDPRQRFADAGQLSQALDACFEEQKKQQLLRQERKDHALSQQKRHIHQLWGVGLSALVIAALILTLFAWGWQQSRQAGQAQRLRAEVSNRFVAANALADASDWEKARTELEGILDSDPKFLPARWLYAEVLYYQFDKDCAVEYLDIACRVSGDQDKARALFWYVFTGLDLGGISPEIALREIGTMTEDRYKDWAEAYYAGFQFNSLYKRSQDNPVEAEKHIRECREWEQKAHELIAGLDHSNWVVSWIHGFFLIQRLDAAPEMKQQHPDEWESLRVKAISHLTESIAANRDFAMTYYYRAYLRKEDPSDFADALRDLDMTDKLMPGWPKAQRLRAECYSSIAFDHKANRRLDEAITSVDQAIECIDNFKTWNLRGKDVYAEQADYIEVYRAIYCHYKAGFLDEAGRSSEAGQARQNGRQALQRLRQWCGDDLSKVKPHLQRLYEQAESLLGR